MSKIKYIVKRDGTKVNFNPTKIRVAISKAMESQHSYDENAADEVCMEVVAMLEKNSIFEPSVEEVQDIVEKTLVLRNYPEIAKAYIIYRHEHNKKRQQEYNQHSKNFIKNIIKRTGEIVPFEEIKIQEAIKKASQSTLTEDSDICEKLCKEVLYYLNDSCPPWETPSVEEIQDIVEKVLIKNNLVDMAKSYILYREEHSRKRDHQQPGRKDYIPYHKLWKTLWFCVDHHCETIPKLNAYVSQNKLAELVKTVESNIENEVKNVSKELEKKDKNNVIFICGPICSGKHALAKKLSDAFLEKEKKIKILDIDNLFEYDRQKQHANDIQIPSITEIEEVKNNIQNLLIGKNIQVNQNKYSFAPQQEILLLIDSYGIVKKLKTMLGQIKSYTIYIEALSQIKDNDGNLLRWTDIRLCRAMMRDKQDGKDIAKTIENWHYIRRREMQYIIPTILDADFVINSFAVYELFLIKKYLFSHFSTWQTNIHTRHLSEFSSTIMRIYHLLESIETLDKDIDILATSLLNQFL